MANIVDPTTPMDIIYSPITKGEKDCWSPVRVKRMMKKRRSPATSPSAKSNRYVKRKLLHKSLFGEVVLAEDQVLRRKVVLKTSDKLRVSGTESPGSEAKLLRKIQEIGGHNNIVELLESSEDEKQIQIALQFVPRDLFKMVHERGGFSETDARTTFQKILQAVKFLHSNGIAHLDLSLENVLINSDTSELRLCDFGAARESKQGERLKNILTGKLNYAAPEILDDRPFEPFKADCYSLGSMLFTILCGHPLYDLESQNGKVALRYATSGLKGVKQLVTAYGYTSSNERTPSDAAIDLIAKLLNHEPTSRPTLEQIENHPWVLGK
eukprot:jgi/Bigna1/87640/estExt_fgenesh1_pg.C_220156